MLLTLDLGFPDIRHYPPGDDPGIVVVRLRDQRPSYVEAVMRGFLSAYVLEHLAGFTPSWRWDGCAAPSRARGRMNVFPTAWSELAPKDVEEFLRGAEEEPLTWEAKSIPRPGSIQKAAAAFANSRFGGCSLLGVDGLAARAGQPTARRSQAPR